MTWRLKIDQNRLEWVRSETVTARQASDAKQCSELDTVEEYKKNKQQK
jgi:hypothetical protein